MPYKKRVLLCCHGIDRASRGTGARFPAATKATGCGGRITVEAVRLDATQWAYRTKNEVVRHNHLCNDAVRESYATQKLISESDLFLQLRAMVLSNAPSKNICDVVGILTGAPFTSQDLANFKRAHLGGNTAFANMRSMLTRFAGVEGNNCLIVDDDTGKIRGIFLQSAAQRAIFQAWGENLLLDFTHNTNNAGFYLGSIMVTTATGKGVSVADFLCTEQTKTMMTTLLSHFVVTNNAVDVVKSVVIDKDYTEWAVLLEVLPQSRVLLCQFHVLKWFRHVVTTRKYGLDVETREAALRILKSMVYAATTTDFQVRQRLLYELLRDVSLTFLQYMSDRWYSCRPMWSDCERSDVFTALNTTNNRLEASWNHLKRMLGRKLRMDLCLESIFSYHTSVLRRELKIISRSISAMLLRARADPFVRTLCRDASDYTSKHIQAQWDAYAIARTRYVCVPRHPAGSANGVFTLETLAPGSQRHTVDSASWSCTCKFAVTSALPCRHALFVARDILKLPQMPIEAVHPRWRMSYAAQLLPILREGIAHAQSLRTCILHADMGFATIDDENHYAPPVTVSSGGRTQRATVAHVRLRRNEGSTSAVLSNLEKRRRFITAIAGVQKALMAMSTPRFMRSIAQLESAFVTTVASWTTQSPSIDAVDGEASVEPFCDGADGATAMSPVDIDPESLDLESLDLESLDLESLDLESLDLVESLDDPDGLDGMGDPDDPDDLSGHDVLDEPDTREVQGVLDLRERSLAPDALVPSSGLQLSTLRVDGSRTTPTPIAIADISSLKLHIQTTRGVTRIDASTTVCSSGRRAFVEQTSACPVSTSGFVRALRSSPNPIEAVGLWDRFPRLFTDKFLRAFKAKATREPVDSRRFTVNFVIPYQMLQDLLASVRVAGLSDGPGARGAAQGTGWVARLTTDVRGFSEENLHDGRVLVRH